MKKPAVIGFCFFLFSIIFSSYASAALDCQVVNGNCPGGYQNVLGLSSNNNAHAELASESNYNYRVCCKGEGNIGVLNSGYNFLDLYSDTNAHVELPGSGGGYSSHVYISSTGHSVQCSMEPDCVSAGYETCLLSISSVTNAHTGDCNAYPSNRICCRETYLDSENPVIDDLDYYGPYGFGDSRQHEISGVDGGDDITFRAQASDDVGITKVEIWVDSIDDGYADDFVKVAECPTNKAFTSPGVCEFTKINGYLPGNHIHYYAVAYDGAGNSVREPLSGSKNFQLCYLVNVWLNPYIATHVVTGDSINIRAVFGGDTCPDVASNLATVQVDAADTLGNCVIEADAASADMVGARAVMTSKGAWYDGEWTVPNVPVSCLGKMVYASVGSLRDEKDISSWKAFGYDTAFGQIEFADLFSGVTVLPVCAKEGTEMTLLGTTSFGTSHRLVCALTGDPENNGWPPAEILCEGAWTSGSSPDCTFQATPYWGQNQDSLIDIHCKTQFQDTSFFDMEIITPVFSDYSPPKFNGWVSPANDPETYQSTDVINIDARFTDENCPEGISEGTACVITTDLPSGCITNNGITYGTASQSCTGTISLNSCAAGIYYLKIGLSDILGNGPTEASTGINIVVPGMTLVLNNLPDYTTSSDIPVGWTCDNCDSFEVRYTTDSSIPFNNWVLLANSGNSATIPNVVDGKRYYAGIYATKGSDSNYLQDDTLVDRTPPFCKITTQVNIYMPDGFQADWASDDPVPVGGTESSGIDTQIIQYVLSSGGAWSDVADGKCVYSSPAPNPVTCSGFQNQAKYDIRCKVTDKAGHECEGLVSTFTFDKNGPVTTQLKPDPAKKWINSSDPNDIILDLLWDSSDTVSGINCFYLKWRNCTHMANPGNNGNCNMWGNWYYVVDQDGSTDTNCLVPGAGDCSVNTCSGNILFKGKWLDQTNAQIDGDISDKEIYEFDVWSSDIAGNIETHTATDPVIDSKYPTFQYNVFDDSGASVKNLVNLDGESTTLVNITSLATDSISGVEHNYIEYCVTSLGIYGCNIKDGGNTDEWGGSSLAWVEIPYGPGTIISYRIRVVDRAGNWNSTPWNYIVTHTLANFVASDIYLSIGQSYDIKVQVRNTQPEFDTITLYLDGYNASYFLDTKEGNVLENGRRLEVGLNPYEGKIFYVRIFSIRVSEEPFILNLTARSELNPNLVDKDFVKINVKYPASFPGFADWALLLLAILSVVCYWLLRLDKLSYKK